MAINVNDFEPSVSILDTDYISQTDDKIRTIIDEAGTYLETETQSAATQLETTVNTKLSEVTSNPDFTYTSDAVDTLLDAKADLSYVDAIPSSLSKVASNVLLSGNLALASSAVTKSNANITYTGNGSTQSITTGISSVDFTVASNGSGYYHDRTAGDCIVKNDAGTIIESGSCVVNVSKVHIKRRNGTQSHNIFDGLRGSEIFVSSNSTSAEQSSLYMLTDFTATGVTLNGDTWTNTSGGTYILHQTLYTHIKWGLTNQGKRYITAYNPVTREVMTMYQGSGIAGHQIPNALGIKLDYRDVKALNKVEDWGSYRHPNRDMRLNTTKSETDSATILTDASESYDEYSTSGIVNGNYNYISYGFANSETKIITQYQGTGASGNFVETKDVNGVAKKPRRVIIKRIDSTSNWHLHDTARDDDATNNARLWLSLSNAEQSDGDFSLKINPNGFTINNSVNTSDNNSDNASGGQYIALVEFDTTNNNDDTYFDLPIDDTNLNVTAGKLPYTDGRDTTNGAYNVFTQSYTGSVDFSTCPDGIHYVALDSNNTPKFYEKVAIGSYEKEAADDNRLVFNTDDGKWYTTTGGELVTNGTFDSDVSGWTASSGATLTVDSGRLKVAQTSSDGVYAYQTLSLTIGKEYIVSYSTLSSNSQVFIEETLGSLDTSILYGTASSNSTGATFIATASTMYIELRNGTSIDNTSSFFDNISVYKKQATLDTALTTPISFIDDKPYQVASGTPMDRLVDYPSIPKNVMESSYVDGDLEVSGEVKGKNQCTAWVNFDGTTTPPTIRDSYNVSSVIRTATGNYDVYFEEDMDNINYTVNGTSGDTGANYGAYLVDNSRNKFRTTQKLSIWTGAYNTLQNSSYVSIDIKGGKN